MLKDRTSTKSKVRMDYGNNFYFLFAKLILANDNYSVTTAIFPPGNVLWCYITNFSKFGTDKRITYQVFIPSYTNFNM